MAKVPKRDLGFFMHLIRNSLLGREYTSALRFDAEYANRDQPPPNIPDGPAHKLAANYYVNRDPRREVTPPIDLTQNLLSAGDAAKDTAVAQTGTRTSGVPTPGKFYQWD